jgi:MFS family permease
MVGAVICACAHTPTMLLVGRAIQGAGAGATEPIKALIFYDIYGQRERAKWVAFINVSWAIGTVSGPLLGGVFTNSNTMTWVSG